MNQCHNLLLCVPFMGYCTLEEFIERYWSFDPEVFQGDGKLQVKFVIPMMVH